MACGRSLYVRSHDPDFGELRSHFGQCGYPRAVNAIIVRDQNSHDAESANQRPDAASILK
jgi:hypothetical protein